MKRVLAGLPQSNRAGMLLTTTFVLTFFVLAGLVLQATPALAAPAPTDLQPQPDTPAQANARTICVSPTGDYQTVQDAVEAAADGDTILLASSTYHENVVITKTLVIAGRYLQDCSAKNLEQNATTMVAPATGRAFTIDPARVGVTVVISDISAAGDATGLGGAEPLNMDGATAALAAGEYSTAGAGEVAAAPAVDWRREVEQLVVQGLVPGGADPVAVMARIDAAQQGPLAPPAYAAAQAAITPMRPDEVDCGGALYARRVGLQLLNVSFGASVGSTNSDGYGGGACILDTPPTGLLIRGGQFTRTRGSTAGAGVGGGLYVRGGKGSVQIDSVRFYYNIAAATQTGWGGALALVDVQDPVLTGELDCVFSTNVASAGASGQGGAALFLNTPGAQIDHCQFFSNYASGGGAGDSDGGFGPSSGVGGGLYVENSDGITIEANKFDLNVAQAGPPERNYRASGGGAYVLNSQQPVIVANVFDRNIAGFSGQGFGGGLAVIAGQSQPPLAHATIAENEFTQNWANVVNYIGSGGGGLFASHLEDAQIISNTFSANVANLQGDARITLPGAPLVLGGGATLNELKASRVAANVFLDNVSTLGGFGLGGGLGLRKSEQMTVTNNSFRRNLGNGTFKGSGLGGALAVEGGRFVTIGHNFLLENSGNLVTSGDAGMAVSALALIGDNPLEPAREMINLFDVVVDGNQILDSGRGLPMQPGDAPPSNFALHVQATDRFTVTNNVIAGSTIGGIVAIYRNPGDAESHGAIRNNTLYDNGQYGIWLLSRWSTDLLSITNNSIVSHTVGVEGEDLFGPSEPVTLGYTLFFSNTQDLGPAAGEAITGTHSVYGNPSFFAPDANDFHLLPLSAARNAGDPGGVPPAPPLDMEGTPRPYGPHVDIGAYEWHAPGQAFLSIIANQ